jgi:hypothetical protein
MPLVSVSTAVKVTDWPAVIEVTFVPKSRNTGLPVSPLEELLAVVLEDDPEAPPVPVLLEVLLAAVLLAVELEDDPEAPPVPVLLLAVVPLEDDPEAPLEVLLAVVLLVDDADAPPAPEALEEVWPAEAELVAPPEPFEATQLPPAQVSPALQVSLG